MNTKFRLYVKIFSLIFVVAVLISYKLGTEDNRATAQDLYNSDPAVRKAAAEMLGETMSATGMVILNELAYTEPDEEVKAAMFDALEKIENRRNKTLKKSGSALDRAIAEERAMEEYDRRSVEKYYDEGEEYDYDAEERVMNRVLEPLSDDVEEYE